MYYTGFPVMHVHFQTAGNTETQSECSNAVVQPCVLMYILQNISSSILV